jgi:hypothetical protein
MGKEHMTVSVRKGWKAWLEKAARERDLDISKFTRRALDYYIRSIEHDMSPRLRRELDELRKESGGHRVGEIPL